MVSTEINCLGEVDRKDYKSISTQMMQPKTKIADVESNSMIQLSPKFSFNIEKLQFKGANNTTIDFCKNNIQS
jgi:hypothetical protein